MILLSYGHFSRDRIYRIFPVKKERIRRIQVRSSTTSDIFIKCHWSMKFRRDLRDRNDRRMSRLCFNSDDRTRTLCPITQFRTIGQKAWIVTLLEFKYLDPPPSSDKFHFNGRASYNLAALARCNERTNVNVLRSWVKLPHRVIRTKVLRRSWSRRAITL